MTKPNAPINSIPDLNNHPSEWYGLTKREYFAAMAMQGMLANGCSIDIDKEYPFETRAKTCLLISDALIKALNESKPTENETTTNTH